MLDVELRGGPRRPRRSDARGNFAQRRRAMDQRVLDCPYAVVRDRQGVASTHRLALLPRKGCVQASHITRSIYDEVVDGLDAAHRAVGLPGSSHAEAALARGLDLVILLDERIVEGRVVELDEHLGWGLERRRARRHLNGRLGSDHPSRRASKDGNKDREDGAHCVKWAFGWYDSTLACFISPLCIMN